MADEEIKLGQFVLTTPQARQKRIAMLLWGQSGVGKTTFAGTAPGRKLWVNFDPDGTDSLAHLDEDEVQILDLSSAGANNVERFKEADPIKIGQQLLADDKFDSVVVDSTSTFGDLCLRHGVVRAAGTKQGRDSTLEQPGLAGYGFKNAWVSAMVNNMLRLTAKYNKHIIIIAHEDKPELSSEGSVSEVSIMLGSSLKKQIAIPFSEIWFMRDDGKQRHVHVRPYLYYKPMKTRMFTAEGKGASFVWKYDIDTPHEGVTIASIYDRWVANGGKKIELPK